MLVTFCPFPDFLPLKTTKNEEIFQCCDMFDLLIIFNTSKNSSSLIIIFNSAFDVMEILLCIFKKEKRNFAVLLP